MSQKFKRLGETAAEVAEGVKIEIKNWRDRKEDSKDQSGLERAKDHPLRATLISALIYVG